MSSLNFDPCFRGDWLDVMLQDPTHPVRLLASHLRAGEDVVAVEESPDAKQAILRSAHQPAECSFSKLPS